MKRIVNENEKVKMLDRNFEFDSIDDAKMAIEKENKRKKIWIFSYAIAAVISLIIGIVMSIIHQEASSMGFGIVAFIPLSLVVILVSSGISLFRWCGRAAKIVSSPFIFLAVKLLAGLITAYMFFFVSIIYFFIPWLMSLRQGKYIIQSAEKYIEESTKITREE